MSCDSADMHREAPPPGRAIGAVLGNVVSGCRLSFGRRVARSEFRISFGHLLFALTLNWCATVLVHRIEAGAGSLFWIWGFISISAKLQVWLAALAVIAWGSVGTGAFVTLVTVIVYASLPVWVVTFALQAAADLNEPYLTIYAYCVLLWHLAIFWRAFRLLPSVGTSRTIGALALYCAALFVITDLLPDSRMFYQQTESAPGLDIESVYYRQAALLDRELDALAPEIPAHADVYFMGVGAYASQDVFMREVKQVRNLFEGPLGLVGRAVSLVNNPATVWDTPLANLHNLKRATTRLSGIMNVDQDILFLFVTSHGNEDGSVAVGFGDLGLNDIYASDIRGALDAAGIRWRVVVVSACYSGAFIDELKTSDTLVITAAARDRASFGCSHENDWTYFGRAYFEQALVETRDFVEAFEVARTIISKRERDEGKEASKPQIWTGEAIAKHLQAWQPLADRR
ncbi:MAG: C13 family peptidase [Pseudomonadota bacterium]|nr:C13 family peptidase [Pseudomonadota bacterium]